MSRFQKRPTSRDLEEHFRNQASDLRRFVEKIWDVEEAMDALVELQSDVTSERGDQHTAACMNQAAFYCGFDQTLFVNFLQMLLERGDARCARKAGEARA